MRQHVAHSDRGLAIGAELRPELGNGGVVGQQSAVDEAVQNRRSYAFARGKDHRTGVGGPWHLTVSIRPAGPDIDDGFAIDIDRKRTAAETRSAGKQLCEGTDGTTEPGVSGALYVCGQSAFCL